MTDRILFDSHLDLAWNAIAWKRDLRKPLDEINRAEQHLRSEKARASATTCFPEMRKAKVAVCLGTMMARVPYGTGQVHGVSLDFPAHENAFAYAYGQLGYYRVLHELGVVSIIRTAVELEDVLAKWKQPADSELASSERPLGLILAMEGCDAIVEPNQAEHWFELGLRCASLVHYGKSAYAVGTGEDGPLTSKGRELLAEFDRIGMILDLTHLSDTSFFEAIDAFTGPVLASHQNCRQLVPGQRQFTDEQINLIIERGGVLGVAMDAWMLHPGYERDVTKRELIPFTAIADHIDHVCQLAGNCNHIAIGSDLDGGFGTEQCPMGLDTIADLQKLAQDLADRGYASQDIDNVFHANWSTFFKKHLP